MSSCKRCFNPNKEAECCLCVRNPKKSRLSDKFVGHPYVCKYGYTDCVLDPYYIWLYHREWFVKLYGDVDYKQCVCEGCKNGSLYDDEDK